MKIIISGTVGVGKTTICNFLYKKLSIIKKTILYKELQINNPYLSFYYKNINDWSFLIQIDFLLERYKTYYKEIFNNKNEIVIFDRSYVDDFIFANLNSIKESLGIIFKNLYYELNKILKEKINKNDIPDYFFLLKSDINSILKRIKNRGRDFEQDEKLNEYWNDLFYQYYENDEIQKYIKNNVKNFYVIDASKKPNEIINEILEILEIK